MGAFWFAILGCGCFAAVFAGGALFGWKLRGMIVRKAAPDPTDQEQLRLMEEQKAFRCLQNYSAEQAYGGKI